MNYINRITKYILQTYELFAKRHIFRWLQESTLSLIIVLSLSSCNKKEIIGDFEISPGKNQVRIDWENFQPYYYFNQNARVELYTSRNNWILSQSPYLDWNIGGRGYIDIPDMPAGEYWIKMEYVYPYNPLVVITTDEIKFSLPEAKGLDKDIRITYSSHNIKANGFEIKKIEYYPVDSIEDTLTFRFWKIQYYDPTKTLLNARSITKNDLPVLLDNISAVANSTYSKSAFYTIEICNVARDRYFKIDIYPIVFAEKKCSSRYKFTDYYNSSDSLIIYGDWRYVQM